LAYADRSPDRFRYVPPVVRSVAIASSAVGIAALAIAGTTSFWHPGSPPVMFFVLPVLASAWLGDVLAIVLAAVLAALTAIYVVPGGGFSALDTTGYLRLAVFLAIAASVALLVRRLRGSEHRQRAASSDLEVAEARLQAAIRARELQLRLIVDAVPALIAYVDAEGRYGIVNRAYAEWFDLNHEHLSGRHLVDVLGAEYYAELRPHVEAALQGRQVDFETELAHHGVTRVLRASHIPDTDEHAVRGFFVLMLDVTADRQRESALRDAEREARLANDLKDQFLATLSHELRTPLNAMLGYARLAELGVVPYDRAMEVVARNAGLQARLVEDLLDVSRMVSGKLQFTMDAVDLAAVAGEVLHMLLPLADAKSVRLIAEIPTSGPVMNGDGARLRQMLVNLVSNAVKFTPGKGTVVVRVGVAADGVEITVEDTGVGIAGDLLPVIFDRFRQADSSTAREHGGLGLGLSIARTIAEAHGGRISASSPGVGLGSTFTVHLPLPAAKPVPDAAVAAHYV
jgi:PAS domain S-box-containing protein